MKKKAIFVLLLMLALAAILCACGGEAEGTETVTTPVETLVPSPEPAEEPTAKPTAEPTPEPAVEPTPEPTVEPAPELPQESTAASEPASAEVPESKENAEPIASSVDQIPEINIVVQEPSGVIGDGTTGIDPNDPWAGYPDYEGPKPGLEFNPLLGYYDPNAAASASENAINNAETLSYWDWTGHSKRTKENPGMDYRDWVQQNMDWVNAYCQNNGITYEKYCKDNKIDP